MAEAVVTGGTVITPSGPIDADVVIRAGRIEAISEAGCAPERSDRSSAGGAAGARTIDARGCYVLPGGVDPHTHLMSDIGTATRAALHGGTTTALSFTSPRPGEGLGDALRRTRDELVPEAEIDIGLHASVWEPERLRAEEIAEVSALGGTGVKLFLAFGELGMMASDRVLYETLRSCAAHHLVTLVHCENGGVIAARIAELVGSGRNETHWFTEARPAATEVEAVVRTLAVAKLAGAPVYLVHQSCAASLDALAGARESGQLAWGEACPHHLIFTEERYREADGERFLVVPPLRAASDRDRLWAAVADGQINSIGSDHAQGRTRPVDHAPRNFAEQPYGIAGVELRMEVVLSEGRGRGVPLQRLVQVLASGPARIFGLYPRKGALAPGADADLVIWDPAQTWTIEDHHLHDGLPDSPYLGLRVEGRVRSVIRGGELVIERGQRVAAGPPPSFLRAAA
ncbi:MAG: amidohydrolase family protein [Solirubrobacteraceae bacterium]